MSDETKDDPPAAAPPSAWNGPFPRRLAPRAPYPNSPAHSPHGVRGAGIRAALNLTGQTKSEQIDGNPVAIPTGTSPFLPPPTPKEGSDTEAAPGQPGKEQQKPATPLGGPPGLFSVNPLGGVPKERPAIEAWTDS